MRLSLDSAALPLDPGALPPELCVDATDRSRGIIITLREPTLPLPRNRRGAAIDCAGALAPDTPIRALQFAVVDVETTGCSWVHGDRVTEIAAVRVSGDGTVLDEYRTLVNPERPIPYDVAALTNITHDMVRTAPRFADVAADVARALAGAVFVAHNAPFDWRFLGAELDRAGRRLLGRTLCTVRLARRIVPEIRSRSLDALSYFFDVHNEARHRAYGDARATARIFRRLLDRLDTREVTRWDELELLLLRRSQRRKRQANPHWAPDPW